MHFLGDIDLNLENKIKEITYYLNKIRMVAPYILEVNLMLVTQEDIMH